MVAKSKLASLVRAKRKKDIVPFRSRGLPMGRSLLRATSHEWPFRPVLLLLLPCSSRSSVLRLLVLQTTIHMVPIGIGLLIGSATQIVVDSEANLESQKMTPTGHRTLYPKFHLDETLSLSLLMKNSIYLIINTVLCHQIWDMLSHLIKIRLR